MPLCTAHTKAGAACRRAAIVGGRVCWTHGGATRAAQRKARERVAAEKARTTVTRLREKGVLIPVTDPYEALCLLAAETVEFKDQLATRVAELTDIRYRSQEGSEQLRAEVSVYSQLLRDSVHVLAQLARLQLDDRRVRIAEAQARMVTAAVLAALTEARLTPPQLAQARHTIAQHLRTGPIP